MTRAVGTPRQAVMTRSYTDPSFPFYLASETDYNGNMVTFVRDPITQRVVRKNYPTPDPTPQDPSPAAVYEEFAYNAYGQLTSHRLANGHTEFFKYFDEGSDQGHPTLVRAWTDPDRKDWIYGYDSLHRRISVTDPRGHTTLYEYDLRDRVTRIIHPEGRAWQEMEYDAFGNRTLLRDEAGAVWTWEYDQQNRLVSATAPGAEGEAPRVTTYQYGSGSASGGSSCSCSTVDQPTLITLPSGRQTRICYDLRWRKISETVGYGTADAATTHYTWEDNLVKTVTDPRSKLTTYFYDERGRRTKIINPLGPVAGKWEFTYDANGNLLTTVRPAGFGYTENAYDKLNRLVQTWDPKRQSVSYAYDSGGRRKLLRDPRGYDYTFEHNGRNKMTKFNYPGGSFEQWTYDDAGNKASYRTRGNVLATYVYDARNRQTAENWSDGVTPSVSRSFDEVGRPLTVVNVHSAITYTYHPGGELKTETQDVTGADGPRTLTYDFDPDGRRSRLTYPSGLVLDYAYTGRGQLESIRANGQPAVVSYAYDGAGNRTLKTLENGTWTDYAYDDVSRVNKIDHRSSATGGASFSRLDYGYNSVHSRTWIKRDNSGRGDALIYDEADQLIDAKIDALNPDTTPTGWTSREEFAYDSAGNRESYVRTVDGTVSESHSYGSASALNQYLSINGQSLSHNLAGSTTFDPLTGVSVTYDAKERPLNLTKSAGGPVAVNEKRDGNYRIVTRTVDSATTYYVWDNWKLVEETWSSNATVSHVNGARVDEIVVRRRPDGMMTYFHQDAQQSTVVLTTQAGLPVERYSYLAYGQCTVRDGTGATIRSESHYGNLHTFLGRQALFSGLYDFRNRVANSKLGQWSQADPIRFAARDSNIMRFLRNNPVRWIDPYGLDVDNSSDEWISVYPEDDLRAVLIPPGGRFVGGQEGFIVTPSAELTKGRNYFKTVDFVNARYYGNGRAEAFPSIWRQIGQLLIGGWRADPFLPLTKPAHDNCIRYNDPDKDSYELNPDRDPWEPQTGLIPEDLLPVRI